ncbi:hypothetical protein QFC19_003955 [Naganishia cerealis]|uniref:Uncharacterized protein n=1 Tax=Naganishia cerealis TaxID=610337 RepID=A0ACC2VYZ1_9TREE|nr:hypothetical protein QFC19_003955 [Naganishia cerealis]
MHSTMDCIAGSVMGWACWQAWNTSAPVVERWVEGGHWTVPLISIVVCLTLVHKHPEPIDDCPCFEDAIAILSVILGSFLCHWFTAKYGVNIESSNIKPMTTFAGLHQPWATLAAGLLAISKIALGIAIIFSWRILCKKTMRFILPKVFRAFAQTFRVDLPTRKHYKAATDYQEVPASHGIAAMPSFVNLPSEAVVASALRSGTRKYLHLRATDTNLEASSAGKESVSKAPEDPAAVPENDEHYDIDGTYTCQSVPPL